jgi:xanthine dehydrogenase molybdenum-binding subunit
MKQDEFNIVGKITQRKDGISKVSGETSFVSDIRLPRMLHARLVSSPYAHARIKRIDTRAAEALGAVCLTFDDIPHVRYNERIITVPWALHKDRYILAEKVRRMGEAVAAVAAETEALAEKAARAVVVEYEPLPVVTDPIEAMQPGSEPLYDTVLLGDREIKIENNIACERVVEEGDVDRAFAEADIILGGTFRTPKVYHSQMETKSVVCRPEGDGGITVWPTAQSIHNVRIVLGQLFGIPLSKVSVVKVPVGGTFGSSIQMNTPVPICVALALKARRPVKLTLTREEDMHDHSNFPTQIDIKIAAKRDGTLVGAQADLVTDIGAHILQAYSFLGVSVGWMASLYKFRNIRYRGRAVYTNKVPSCAMQGFGNPQMTFAVESLIDELAEKLGLDPIALRLKNYVGLGDTFWGQGPQVRSVIQSDGVQQLLRRGAELMGAEATRGGGDTETRRHGDAETGGDGDTADMEYGIRNTQHASRYRRGIGLGRGFHTSSAGAPKPSDVIDFSGAMVKINQDGSVDIVTALMDHGGGTLEALAKLVAETLCVPLEKVNMAPAETCSTVYDVTTHATRGVYAGGGAAVKVAKQIRRELIETAARFMNFMPDALTIRLDAARGQGVIYCPSVPEVEMTIGEVAHRCWTDSWKTIAVVDSYRPTSSPPAYVSVFVEVEVDTWTGQVRTLRAAMGSDCGTVVNPDMAVGQLEGGLSKGAGFALYENNDWDRDGQLVCRGYWVDNKTPAISESPPVADLQVHFADTYEPTGPWGAKGIGEAAMNPVAAAYANAVYSAIGIRFRELPMTPEKILAALREHEQVQAEVPHAALEETVR